jgi:hypothetical protein
LNFETEVVYDDEIQTFYFDAYPSVVFNTAFMAIDVITQGLGCKLQRTLSFDAANTLNEVSWAAAPFIASSTCNPVLNPYLFGYSVQFPESAFTISVDMNTFVTAVAINTGIRTWGNLGVAEPNTFSVEYNGGNYTLSFKVSRLRLLLLLPCFDFDFDLVTLPCSIHFRSMMS